MNCFFSLNKIKYFPELLALLMPCGLSLFWGIYVSFLQLMN